MVSLVRLVFEEQIIIEQLSANSLGVNRKYAVVQFLEVRPRTAFTSRNRLPWHVSLLGSSWRFEAHGMQLSMKALEAFAQLLAPDLTITPQ